MSVLNQWTELLTRPNCGMSGSAHLSMPEKRAYDFNVEAIHANPPQPKKTLRRTTAKTKPSQRRH
jgi:hypothetical protein